jgi:hypothetical protein
VAPDELAESRQVRTLTPEQAETELPDWSNDQDYTIEVAPTGTPGTWCEDSNHAGLAVRMFASSSCAICGGEDPYGATFCPVCDYCCGC